MQVILDSSFALPGSAPIWGGKKVDFRDWTKGDLESAGPYLNKGLNADPSIFQKAIQK